MYFPLNMGFINFNSHAHVERDMTWTRCQRFCKISTHTLTWSVTETAIIKGDGSGISTHTLTWSVTIVEITRPAEDVHFNSHAHVERDNRQVVVLTAVKHFNSHAHVERDAKCGVRSSTNAFQLTRSRGA